MGTSAHDPHEPSDLDRRTPDGFVVWGPLPATDPLRAYRAERVAAFAPVREVVGKVERRRRSRRTARDIRALAAAIRKAA